MSTRTRTITTMTCDRCDIEDHDQALARASLWGRVHGQNGSGSPILNGYEMDLCPDCIEQLTKWCVNPGIRIMVMP